MGAEIGGFNELYKMYYEDVDLCLRLKKRGINSYIISSSIIFHHISHSIGGKMSFDKMINKSISFLKFLYLNNTFILFIYYLFINILFIPFYLLLFVYKKVRY